MAKQNGNTTKTETTSQTEGMPRANERLEVFSVRGGQNGNASIWTRCGTAWVNRDGSLNVYLDVLPLDGKLHLRRRLVPINGGASETPDTAN